MRHEISFSAHPCTKACVVKWETRFNLCLNINPLLKPLFHGWQRLRSSQPRSTDPYENCIRYIAPCGRSLRDETEVEIYLEKTDSKLSIDMFTFDKYTDVAREFESATKNVKIQDITKGKENVPISCVNNVNDDEPYDFEYSTISIPLEGVPKIDSSQLEGKLFIFTSNGKKSGLFWILDWTKLN